MNFFKSNIFASERASKRWWLLLNLISSTLINVSDPSVYTWSAKCSLADTALFRLLKNFEAHFAYKVVVNLFFGMSLSWT